jgi:hypothetical protein
MFKDLFLAQSKIDQAILATPTGPARELMTEANMILLSTMQELSDKRKSIVDMQHFESWHQALAFMRKGDAEIVGIVNATPSEGVVIFYR